MNSERLMTENETGESIDTRGAGEDQLLVQRTWLESQPPHGGSVPSGAPVQKVLTPSSGPHGHQART